MKEYEYKYKLIDKTWISQKELDELEDYQVVEYVTEVRRTPKYKMFGEMSAAEQMKLIAAYQTGHVIECTADLENGWTMKDRAPDGSIIFSGNLYYRVQGQE